MAGPIKGNSPRVMDPSLRPEAADKAAEPRVKTSQGASKAAAPKDAVDADLVPAPLGETSAQSGLNRASSDPKLVESMKQLLAEVSAKASPGVERAARADLDISFDASARDLPALCPKLMGEVGVRMGEAIKTGDDVVFAQSTEVMVSLQATASALMLEEAPILLGPGVGSPPIFVETSEAIRNALENGLLDHLTVALDSTNASHESTLPDSIGRGFGNDLNRFTSNLPHDINALVQFVLRESYLETTKDLQFYAEKVKFYNEVKKEIRSEVKRARDMMTAMAGKDDSDRLPEPLATRPIDKNFTGGPVGFDEAPALSAEQQAALTQREADIEQVNNDIEAWESSPDAAPSYQPRATASMAMPTSSEQSLDGAQRSEAQVREMINTYGREFAAQVMSMPAAERQALFEHWKTNGFDLSLGAEMRDPQNGWDANRTIDIDLHLTGPATDDIEFFLARIFEQVGDRAVTKYDQTPGGIMGDRGYGGIGSDSTPAVDLYALSLIPGLPSTVDMPVPAQMPSELQERANALGISTGGRSADSGDGWTVGEPCETKAELQSYIEGLESDLQSVGDDAQLANVDLQNMLQKQQQTLQMMSNISKQLHDTALSVIRKIG